MEMLFDEIRPLPISEDYRDIWCPLRHWARLFRLGRDLKTVILIERNHQHLAGKEERYSNLLGIQASLKPSEDEQEGDAGKAKFTWVESLHTRRSSRIEGQHELGFRGCFFSSDIKCWQ
jgi:hypothetical protein